MKSISLLSSFVLMLLCGIANASVHEVSDLRYLTSDEYYSFAAAEIKSAKKSILLAMYLVWPGGTHSPVNSLMDLMGTKRSEGVNVKVILDDDVKGEGNRPFNLKAITRFQQQGVYARFDNTRRVSHVKLLIIDDETVFIGSQNWTSSALGGSNYEHAVMVKSEELAGELKSGLIQRIGSKEDVFNPEKPDELINVNSAGVQRLIRLPGIGKTMAERIIAYRNEHGKFKNIDDLKNVPGIGDKVGKKLKDKIIF